MLLGKQVLDLSSTRHLHGLFGSHNPELFDLLFVRHDLFLSVKRRGFGRGLGFFFLVFGLLARFLVAALLLMALQLVVALLAELVVLVFLSLDLLFELLNVTLLVPGKLRISRRADIKL